jgi:Zn-dependent M16 (insulinase) family peptidase
MPDADDGRVPNVGSTLHGFICESVEELPNLRARALVLRHETTGAAVVHISNDDTENLFSVTFPTPPPDDTGVPHILEHAVLDGSEKYPVKRPFFEMIKMSMATFINAMTGSDRTMYPVSSNVERDLFNLAEVYFDAVFHPRLSRNTFMQEGHHIAFAEKGDLSSPLTINGIVYNEMKGAFSNPDAIVGRRMVHDLLPDTAYSKESGGDPDCIPDLTYEDFKRFHATYYHPSNAHFIFYGNIPTAKYLAFLEERLAGYTRSEVDVSISRQPRWDAPRSAQYAYPIGADESATARAYIVSSWLVGDGSNASEALAFHVLNLALVGNQAAPLRKALVDSALGQDLTHSGFYTLGTEALFSIGMKGCEEGVRDELTSLIERTLQKIADEGLGSDRIASAFQQLSYRYLEIQSMFPLHVMMKIQDAWLSGQSPSTYLKADELIAALRKRCEDEPGFLEDLIRERLIRNPHRLVSVFVPDKEIQKKKDDATAETLAARKESMSAADLEVIKETSARLETFQGTPNAPEDIDTLPQLKVTDLPAKPRRIPTTVETFAGGDLLTNDVFSNGVSYLQLDLPLEGLDAELYPYLALYGACVRKMGAAGQDYVKIAERTAAYTGGIGMWSHNGTLASDPAVLQRRARFAMKALDTQIAEALQLLGDVLLDIDFTDTGRLREVVNQRKVELRGSLAYAGSSFASHHAAMTLNPACYANELAHGLPQFRTTERLSASFDELAADATAKLEAIRNHIRSCGTITASYTGSADVQRRVLDAVRGWAGRVSADPPKKPRTFAVPQQPPRDGLAAPMNVAHCAVALPAPHLSDGDTPALMVGGRLLSIDHLLEEIRIKGGAYGAGCHHDAQGCSWRFSSFNDPAVKRTLDTFAHVIEYVRAKDWSRDDIDRAIIGSAKSAEAPIRPAPATGQALQRHVCGDTHELRESRYAAMLRVTPAHAKQALVSLLEKGMSACGTCVVSSRERLLEANTQMSGNELRIEDIIES